eukprot:s1408_g16.t1
MQRIVPLESMVSAMTFCPNFSTIVTGEVDMTLKCYSLSLDLVESFALEQARLALRGDKEKKSGRKASGKVTCLECLSTAGSFILAGSECGCELWQLTKSRERRINTSKLRGLEYHLQLNLVKQITTEPVYRIVCSAEQRVRVIVAGYKTLVVLDNELTLVASCNMPFVCSAHLHMLSSSQAEMMTGAASGAVHLWSIQAFDAPVGSAVSDGLCTRLEHTFYGHTRPVEMVCFYSRPEKAVAQRFAVSCGLDLRVQVWSLDSFVRIYTLDINLTDSKAHVFPISLHLFAVSYTVGGSTGDSQKGASVALIRFNIQISEYGVGLHGPWCASQNLLLIHFLRTGFCAINILPGPCQCCLTFALVVMVVSLLQCLVHAGLDLFCYSRGICEEVWSKWEAAVPDEETKLLLAELDLPEASRWVLLAESLRWAARGHDFLRTFSARVHAVDLPKEQTAKFFQVSSVSSVSEISSASGLIRLAVTALAEMLARSRQSVEKSELCALLWRLDRLEPGDRGGDLPACVGDVLTVIHDCCTALELECPWPKELDGHLDLMLFAALLNRVRFQRDQSIRHKISTNLSSKHRLKDVCGSSKVNLVQVLDSAALAV